MGGDDVHVKLASANEWLYPDDGVAAAALRRIRLSAARGSYAACQLLAAPTVPGSGVDWTFELLGLPGVAAGDCPFRAELFQLIDVNVEVNTGPVLYTVRDGEEAGGYVTRKAPFRVYDAMQPLTAESAILGEKAAFYLRIRVPEQTEPGVYDCRLGLRIGGVRIEAQVGIEVFAARLPARETLAVSNWFSLNNMAERHALAPWSEAHWDMVRRYAVMMRHVRQTHFLVPIELVRIEREADGSYRFDFDRARRFIALFLGLGFTTIEGGPAAVQLQLGDPQFMLKTDPSVAAASPAGIAWLTQYFTAWNRFLSDHGLLPRTVQHAADEPFDASLPDYRLIAGLIRRHMPGVPVIEAVCTHEAANDIDIVIPTNQYYEERRETFEAKRREGGRLWFYTCSLPGGYYTNRLMDIPLLKTRLMHWGNYIYRLDGYLHWGFNGYRPGQNPFERTCPVHMADRERKRSPAGNTHIVYPGAEGPWGSVRLEAMRSGVEDYELLALLASSNREEADGIAAAVMNSFSDPAPSPDAFDAAHRRLLQAVSGKYRS